MDHSDFLYNSPDDDPFRCAQSPLRPHFQPQTESSLLDKWIHDQALPLHDSDDDSDDDHIMPHTKHLSGTPTNPQSEPDDDHGSQDHNDASTLFNYDLVDDDDIPAQPEIPSTPIIKPRKTFRNLNRSFRASHPAGTASMGLSIQAIHHPNSPSEPNTSTSASNRMSIFSRPRAHRHSAGSFASSTSAPQHARSSSLTTLNTMRSGKQGSSTKPPSAASRWLRPSVLGHFASTSSSSSSQPPFDPLAAPNETPYTPPRPSLSSGDTYLSSSSQRASQTMSLTSTLESDLPSTPSKVSFFESIRSRNGNRSSLSIGGPGAFKPHHGHASSSSIWSQPQSRVPSDSFPRRDASSRLSHHSLPRDLAEGAGDCRSSRNGASARASTVASFSAFQDAGGTLPRRMPFAIKSVNRFDNLLDDEDDLLAQESGDIYPDTLYRMGHRHLGYQSQTDISVPTSKRDHNRKSMSVTSLAPPPKKNRMSSFTNSFTMAAPAAVTSPVPSSKFGTKNLTSTGKSLAGSLSGTLRSGTLKVPNQKKKKKLVISGVGVHETRKFEGVKTWCESFGEIRQISRVPNGDLHIEFRKADVADTVCRIRAKVFISGVGSVYLSWTAGDKR